VLEVGSREAGGVGEVARQRGITHGEKNDTRPAIRATGIASTSDPEDAKMLEPVSHPAPPDDHLDQVRVDGTAPLIAAATPLGVEHHGRGRSWRDHAGEGEQRSPPGENDGQVMPYGTGRPWPGGLVAAVDADEVGRRAQFFAAATTYGDSLWQSAHHAPHTLTTVGLPCIVASDSGRPSRSFPDRATGLRSATAIWRIAPSPLT
jgi:hypothetical protein